MPRYVYKCDECHEEFMVFHLISEDLEKKEGCSNSCNLHRIPQLTRDPKKAKRRIKKVGQVVNEYIEEVRNDIARERDKRMEIE